jgi:hypothetical protein
MYYSCWILFRFFPKPSWFNARRGNFPILFAIYVNDCEMDFLNNCCQPVELKELSLFLLMYADDMVIFPDTIKGLQDMLNTLYCYTEKWKLCVNINKIKIVVLNRVEL